jgi:EAL domain-containing protein (putative c-di-GMP-specific phosphodiesterase class I)
VEGREIALTVSIGIALPHVSDRTPETLLRNAHTALSHAKETQRPEYVLFDQTMHAHAMEQVELESELRKAIKQEDFHLLFQPQIQIKDQKLVGAEVLLRWQHARRGYISPAKFIPMAEKTGLILELGHWVIRQACEQWKAWEREGLSPFRLAINISGHQFKSESFIDSVKEILSETRMPPQWLEFEITETILMDKIETTQKTLWDLHQMGITISIDDFGTGYSSLSYLKRFPIDTLKIDGSFIRELTLDNDDAAITAAIVALAHNLNQRVIAEGVETEEQLAYLKSLECEEVQGFFFAKPLAPPDFVRFRNSH